MDQEVKDFISPEIHGNKNEMTAATLLNKDNPEEWESGSSTLCTSAKQCRKMPNNTTPTVTEDPEHVHVAADKKDMKLTYTWKQTANEVIIFVKISNVPDVSKVLDVYFNSKDANISISGTEKHVITFHDLIQKEMSQVKILKGNITMHLVKQCSGLWPTLEASSCDDTPNCVIEQNASHETVPDEGKNDMVGVEDGQVCNGGDKNKATDRLMTEKMLDENVSSNKIEIEKIEQRQPEFMDKDEEPVYHLDHLKHDFFQKGSILTLQIFTRSVDKDAVKIVFSSQGFVVKFCTSDQKFLHLHEGTTADTTFSWTVRTRKDIVPEECEFKVKQTVIEILLHTTTVERWASLEAAIRKVSEPSKSDTWMPLNAQTKSAPIASSKVDTSSHEPVTRDNKKVVFDEMADVHASNKPDISEELEPSVPFLADSVKFKSHTSQDWNKPTAKVQPLNKIRDEGAAVVSPGYAGLVNFGNTCFMNCVIQVLSNTQEFRDYFLDGRFEEEINEDNPLGMKGHLAATFGILLRWLWSCKKYCWEPRKLKDLISKKNPQFFGFAQHDAHEFLAFLLDGLHEDLNRIRQKPYTQTVDSNGRPDEVVAAEAWALYKQRNDSVVVDMFQGQYKSKLVCPKCDKVSITFDPFLYLSVPLPKKKKLIHVTFIWKEFYKKPVRHHIQVCHESSVERLLEELSQRTGVNSVNIRVFEAYKGRVHKFFQNGASLSYVDDKSVVIACEVLSEELAGEDVIEIPVVQRTLSPPDFPTQCAACDKYCNEGSTLKRCTNCYKVGYCNQACQRKHWTLHKSQCNTAQQAIGCPFIVSLPASRLTYANLMKQMEGFARFSVNLFQPPVKTTENNVKPSTSIASTAPPSNLNSSLSQSCSSLNSLDSLSSASSTCTLTGDQSDSQIPEEGPETGVCDADVGSTSLSSLNDTASSTDSSSDSKGNNDSGFESNSCKSEKRVPMSQVMGVPVKDADREKVMPTFLIQSASSESTSVKGAEWIEDKGDVPLRLKGGIFLAMVWRNDKKLPSYVLVQSKELDAEEVEDVNSIYNASNMPMLYHCLELFTEPEILNPEEAWYCPSCKKHVEASKQMSIWKLPHTLVIQLKRFSFQSYLRRSKIEKRVDFPIRGLDLRRYCVGLSPNEPSPVYDLYGVVNHHGHLIDGHYTSFVRCASDGLSGTDQIGWRLCDDSRVMSIDNEKSVVTKDAYLLFYRRRGMPAIINCSGGSSSSSSTSATTQSNTAIDSLSSEASASVTESSAHIGFAQEHDNDMQIPTHPSNSTSLNAGNVNVNNIERPDPHRSMSGHSAHQQVTGGSCERPGVSSLNLNLETNFTAARPREFEAGELEEKGDREKEFYDCNDNPTIAAFNDDDDEPRLVIQTDSDLGYTDMEAVD